MAMRSYGCVSTNAAAPTLTSIDCGSGLQPMPAAAAQDRRVHRIVLRDSTHVGPQTSTGRTRVPFGNCCRLVVAAHRNGEVKRGADPTDDSTCSCRRQSMSAREMLSPSPVPPEEARGRVSAWEGRKIELSLLAACRTRVGRRVVNCNLEPTGPPRRNGDLSASRREPQRLITLSNTGRANLVGDEPLGQPSSIAQR